MISLCLIVKNDPEEIKHSIEAIKSVENYVDEICLTITYEGDKPNTPEELVLFLGEDIRNSELPEVKISFFEWVKDFSKARTFNCSQAKGDWILWMDADDIFVGGENLKSLVEMAEQNYIDGYWFNYWYQIDIHGMPLETHPKLQMVKNDGHWEWSGKVHENISAKRRSVKWVKTEKIYRVHKYGRANSAEKHKRNLEIMLSEIEKAGDNPDPRDLLYASKALLSLNELEKAEVFLLQYVQKSGWNEEIYEAYMLLGELYRRNQDWKHAEIAYHKAILMMPNRPDAYYGMGYALNGKKDYKKAIDWIETGLTKKIPKGSLVTYWADVTWRPLSVYAWSLLQDGRIDDAYHAIVKAKEMNGNDEYIQITRELIDEVRKKRDTGKYIGRVANYLKEKHEDWKIPALMNAVPQELQDSPMVLSIAQQYLKPKEWEDKDIVIYCPKTVEEWGPPSINEKGLGGSETAVIELSKRLVKLGWKVTVYNWCSTYAGEHEGVTYKNFWEFNWKDKFNALILWRFPDLLDLPIEAKFVGVDLHDVGNVEDFTKTRLERISKIFVKSKAHRELYPEIPDRKFAVIPNGIDPERFKKKVERNQYKIVYSSTQNRGIDVLLDVFPKIREQVPEAELHIYYGQKTYQAIERDNPQSMKFLESLNEKIVNTDGVFDHGRVTQEKLAEEFLSAGVWAYPTAFYEISCISAMEAQKAGCIPVTSDYAALKETVKHGIKIQGDNDTKEYQDKFISEVVKQLKNPMERKDMMKEDFGWDTVAKQWNEIL